MAFFFLLSILWMVTIFMFSAQDASESTEISNVVLKLVKDVIVAWMPNSSDQSQIFFVRKLAHVTEYIILELLFVFTYRERIRAVNVPVFKGHFYGRLLGIPFVLGVLYACSDEFHQRFVPGRAGQLRDVGIDSIGVAIGLGISFLILYVSYLIHKNHKTLS